MVRSGAKGQAWIELCKYMCLGGGRVLEGAKDRERESPRMHLGFFA